MIKYLLIIVLSFTGYFSGDYETKKETLYLCDTAEEVDFVLSRRISEFETGGMTYYEWEFHYQLYEMDLEDNSVQQIDWTDLFTIETYSLPLR